VRGKQKLLTQELQSTLEKQWRKYSSCASLATTALLVVAGLALRNLRLQRKRISLGVENSKIDF